MSVAAIISYQGEDEYIPIATEGNYLRLWIPVIKKLKLKLMAFYFEGPDVKKEDLPALVEELGQFMEYQERRKEDDWVQRYGYERAVRLRSRLVELLAEPFDSVWIG